jgi:hypothetical protein
LKGITCGAKEKRPIIPVPTNPPRHTLPYVSLKMLCVEKIIPRKEEPDWSLLCKNGNSEMYVMCPEGP